MTICHRSRRGSQSAARDRWATDFVGVQRSSLRQITIDPPITPTAVTANDVVLTNLGIDARAGGDADQVISTLRDDQWCWTAAS